MRVKHELHPETLVYFDKETGLPVKTAAKLSLSKDEGRNPLGDAGPESAEVFFDDYKEISGVKHFTKLRARLGDKSLDVELREVKLLKTVDSGAFKKPE